MRRILCITGLFYMLSLNIFSQSVITATYPKVGDTLGNYIFTDVLNFPKNTFSTNDFRGKWLILDTWTTSCTSCIASFPKMDSLQRKYVDKMKIIMVGAMKFDISKPAKVEDVRRTKDLFAHLDKKHNLKLTTVFDTVLYSKYDMYAVPQIMVVSPEGIISAITTRISAVQIDALINGKATTFDKYFTVSDLSKNYKYNSNLPFLTNGIEANGGNDTSYVFRSMLSQTDDKTPDAPTIRLFDFGAPFRRTNLSDGRLECFKFKLLNLFRLAYFGVSDWDQWDQEIFSKYNEQIILSSSDSAKFLQKAATTFVYSLTVPKDKISPSFIMKIMQNDLENYFGFKAVIVKSEIPVFYMEVADQIKFKQLMTKGGKSSSSISYDQMLLIDRPVGDLVRHLSGLLRLDLPAFDNTNAGFKIDIDLRANMLDEKDVASQLKKFGLKFVNGKKEFETLMLFSK